MSSWLSSPAAHAGLLDELVKIGAEEERRVSNKERVKGALKTIALAGLGSAAGYGIARGAQKLMPKYFLAGKPVTEKMMGAAKIGLPILGFAGGILGSRYRTAVDEGMFGKNQPPRTNARR